MDNNDKKLQTSNDDLIEQLLSKATKNEEIKLTQEKSNDLEQRLDLTIDEEYKKKKTAELYKAEMDKTIEYSDFDYLKTEDTTLDLEDGSKEEEPVRKITELEAELDESLMSYQMDTTGKDVVIEFNDVALKIEREQILRDINIKIHEGEFVYFVGASGAGKSSMIKMIYRESKNTKGTLKVLDKNVTKLRQGQLPALRRKVGVVFQDFKLLPDKTIYENVKFSLDVTGYPRKKKHEQVLKVLRQVGIASQKDKYPNELSGGQQQRAAIARAIVDEPSILVCDEPTGNLDPENAIQIMEIITEINESGTTVLMATHDVGIVNKYKHRVVLMKNGRISNEGEGEYIYE